MNKILIFLAGVAFIPIANSTGLTDKVCETRIQMYEDLILEYQLVLDSVDSALKDSVEEASDILYEGKDRIEKKLNSITNLWGEKEK